MSLINCEINLVLNWFAKCIKPSNTVAAQATTFTITDTKFYVPVVTLSTDNDVTVLQQLK